MKKGLFFLMVGLLSVTMTIRAQDNSMTLRFDEAQHVINKNIYGQFAEHLGRCIYDGIWVGPESDIDNINGYRKDVLEALEALQIPVLRWPGGCFADTYHWKDGVGPVQDRPSLVNVFWGGYLEDNSFGTHEFLNLCEMLGTDAYISANVGSGSVKEMVEWIEYMTSDKDVPMANWRRENGREKPWDVKFLGVGNESWGCGGDMTPDYYSNLLRQYSLYAKQYDNSLVRVGCGPNGDDIHWTETLMKNAGRNIDGLSLHYYTIATGSWGNKSASTGFDESLFIKGLKQSRRMDDILARHTAMMDKYDPSKRVGLMVDEWGIWTDSEPGETALYQQNSMRDALIASTTFDIFHKYSERVQMANIAQVVNVLQSMILTRGDKMVLTPTYYVFQMYSHHQGATYIPVSLKSESYSFGNDTIPAISGTASEKDGKVSVNLSNTNPHKSIKVTVDLSSGRVKKVTEASVLTAPAFNSVNTFENPDVVSSKSFTKYKLSKGVLEVVMPPMAIVSLAVE